MYAKIAAVFLALVSLSIQMSLGLDLIEMSDANKNAMNLGLSKALAVVQEAYQHGFRIESGKDIQAFLVRCEYVKQIMAESEDSAFGGLAGKIKAIMADEEIAMACSARGNFEHLDKGFSAAKFDYLSQKVFNKLVRLKQRMESDEAFKAVAQHLISLKVNELSEALMSAASDHVSEFMGEVHEPKGFFDFDITPKRLCEVSDVEPICKLVGRSSQHVNVAASSFEDFAEVVRAKDEKTLSKYTGASGVSMDELKKNCQSLMKKRALRPIELIRSYVSAGFIDQRRIEKQLKEDTELASYSSLYDLCDLVK